MLGCGRRRDRNIGRADRRARRRTSHRCADVGHQRLALDRHRASRTSAIGIGAEHGRRSIDLRNRETCGERGNSEEPERCAQIARWSKRSSCADVRARCRPDTVADRGDHQVVGHVRLAGLGAGKHAFERDRGRQPVGEIARAIDPTRDRFVIEPAHCRDARADQDRSARHNEAPDAGRRSDDLCTHGKDRHEREHCRTDRRSGCTFERPLGANAEPRAANQPLDG